MIQAVLLLVTLCTPDGYCEKHRVSYEGGLVACLLEGQLVGARYQRADLKLASVQCQVTYGKRLRVDAE